MGWFGPSMNRVRENRDQAEEDYNAWVAHRDNMLKKKSEAIKFSNWENDEKAGYIVGFRRAFNSGKMKIPPDEFYDLVERNEKLLRQGVELDDIAKPLLPVK